MVRRVSGQREKPSKLFGSRYAGTENKPPQKAERGGKACEAVAKPKPGGGKEKRARESSKI